MHASARILTIFMARTCDIDGLGKIPTQSNISTNIGLSWKSQIFVIYEQLRLMWTLVPSETGGWQPPDRTQEPSWLNAMIVKSRLLR